MFTEWFRTVTAGQSEGRDDTSRRTFLRKVGGEFALVGLVLAGMPSGLLAQACEDECEGLGIEEEDCRDLGDYLGQGPCAGKPLEDPCWDPYEDCWAAFDDHCGECLACCEQAQVSCSCSGLAP